MIDFCIKLFELLDRDARRAIAALFPLVLFATGLDMIGITMFLPFLQLALNPDAVPDYPLLRDYLALFDDKRYAALYFLLALVAFFALKNGLLICVNGLLNHIVNRQEYRFSVRLMCLYLERDYIHHLQQNSADVVRNITFSSPNVFINGLTAVMSIALEGLLVLGATTVLLIVQPVTTVIAAAIIGTYLITFFLVVRHRITRWGRVLERIKAETIRAVNEGLSTTKEIKVLRSEAYFTEQFANPAHEQIRLRTIIALLGDVPRLAGEVVLLFTLCIVLLVMTHYQNVEFMQTIPQLGLFAAAAMRIMPSANRLMAAINNVRRATGPLENLYIDLKAVAAEHSAAVRHAASAPAARMQFDDAIDLNHVSFRFPTSERPTIEDANISIRKGETIALVGPTGAGKSTLADLILGIVEPASGTICVDGIDIRSNPHGWRTLLGYVPQDVTLLDASLRQNIAFGVPDAEIDPARITTICKIAQVHDVIERIPGGLDARAGERGVLLSGGEKQRIGIARALYRDPEVLVLDEATAALDNTTQRKFAEAISGLRGKKTLIVIAHRLSTVRNASRIFLVDQGKVVDSGSFDELARRNPTFSAMVAAEMTHDAAI